MRTEHVAHGWTCACNRKYEASIERIAFDGPRDASATVPGKRLVFKCQVCGYLHAYVKFATSELRVEKMSDGLSVSEG